jgi:hypothetical protein
VRPAGRTNKEVPLLFKYFPVVGSATFLEQANFESSTISSIVGRNVASDPSRSWWNYCITQKGKIITKQFHIISFSTAQSIDHRGEKINKSLLLSEC